jgi:hypothetical protein
VCVKTCVVPTHCALDFLYYCIYSTTSLRLQMSSSVRHSQNRSSSDQNYNHRGGSYDFEYAARGTRRYVHHSPDKSNNRRNGDYQQNITQHRSDTEKRFRRSRSPKGEQPKKQRGDWRLVSARSRSPAGFRNLDVKRTSTSNRGQRDRAWDDHDGRRRNSRFVVGESQFSDDWRNSRYSDYTRRMRSLSPPGDVHQHGDYVWEGNGLKSSYSPGSIDGQRFRDFDAERRLWSGTHNDRENRYHHEENETLSRPNVTVVVDVNNVAYFGFGVYSPDNVACLLDWCRAWSKVFDFICVTTTGDMHENCTVMAKAQNLFRVDFVQSIGEEDVRCLNLARSLNAWLISNDRFATEIERGLTTSEEVTQRRVGFSITANQKFCAFW